MMCSRLSEEDVFHHVCKENEFSHKLSNLVELIRRLRNLQIHNYEPQESLLSACVRYRRSGNRVPRSLRGRWVQVHPPPAWWLPHARLATDVATYVDDGYLADAINGYWLGATNSSVNYVWQWNDGTAVQIGAPFWAYNWAAGGKTEPNNAFTGENCAMIGAPRGWLLNDLMCTSSGFVVYALCSRTPTNGLCATPYVLVGKQCIHLLLANYDSWRAARTACGATGGDLIILEDCDQYSKVTSYLIHQGYNPEGYWIGGSDEALEGQWCWIDGSPMTMGLPYWANVVQVFIQ
ncbi:macrophage mannose receptor 1-like [Hyalella azteca]|uniref:Macrophage mannose receptor 1-like n=1 Tax=Hyalella azteca TaxID=294128 RepID=A0A979FXY4_HYAAZ|nr:macrophage mannose receptor 1-like [Hyalella azteca]